MKKLILIVVIFLTLSLFITPIVYAKNYCDDDSCVGCWLMNYDEDPIRDDSGEGNTGILRGDPTFTYSGKRHGAYVFDGDEDYVNTNYAFDFQNFTVSAWFYSTANEAGTTYTIVGKVGWTAETSWRLYRYAGTSVYFSMRSISGVNIQLGPKSTNQNQWYYAVGTYDGAQAKFYVDGKLIDTEPNTDGVKSTILPVIIGSTFREVAFFIGSIDDVAIFNRALTEAEINEIYKYGLDGTYRTKIYGGAAQAKTKIYDSVIY